MAEVVKCIDISNYQAGFDFEKFKDSGGLAVILKATEGTTHRDKSYAGFRIEAEESGLAVATYHFFRPSIPEDQADFYFDTIGAYHGERVVCDFEDDTTTIDNMIRFLKQLRLRDPTLQLTVYSGHTIKDKLGTKSNSWLANNTSLWLAQYTTGTPSWPTQVWPQWSLWQYSDQDKVSGFTGAVDTNRFNGDDDQLLAWMGRADIETEEPAPKSGVVRIEVEGSVTVYINGTAVYP